MEIDVNARLQDKMLGGICLPMDKDGRVVKCFGQLEPLLRQQRCSASCEKEGLCLRVRHSLLVMCQHLEWMKSTHPWDALGIEFQMSGSLLDGTLLVEDLGIEIKVIFGNVKMDCHQRLQYPLIDHFKGELLSSFLKICQENWSKSNESFRYVKIADNGLNLFITHPFDFEAPVEVTCEFVFMLNKKMSKSEFIRLMSHHEDDFVWFKSWSVDHVTLQLHNDILKLWPYDKHDTLFESYAERKELQLALMAVKVASYDIFSTNGRIHDNLFRTSILNIYEKTECATWPSLTESVLLNLAKQFTYKTIDKIEQTKSNLLIKIKNIREEDFIYAIESGSLSEATELIDSGAIDVNYRVRKFFNKTLLQLSTIGGRPPIVQMLLTRDADADLKDDLSLTALHYACGWGFLDIVKLLITPKRMYCVDSGGLDPLHHAAVAGHEKIVKFIFEDGQYQPKLDESNSTIFHRTCTIERYHFSYKGHVEIISYLFKIGLNIEARNRDQRTPLHLACMHKVQFEVVERLIFLGAEVNVVDVNGQTPLHLAVIAGCAVPVIGYLIKSKANIEIEDNFNRRPIYYAESKGNESVIKELIKNNADQKDIDNTAPGEVSHHEERIKGEETELYRTYVGLDPRHGVINYTEQIVERRCSMED